MKNYSIPFNIPTYLGCEKEYLDEVLKSHKLSGDGSYTLKCNEWIERSTKTRKSLLTPSCTHALEMAALLCDIEKGDEIIMPSYTFVSTANAFALRGAKIVFIDVRPDTMNMNEKLIENAITEKTKAVVPVHYAGVSCEMDCILEIAKKYNLFVIEDAAQGVMASYKGKKVGGIGDFGCFSFHETKNYTSGEGGAILINRNEYVRKAEIIREKGTNRTEYVKGIIDKYKWVDIGSSYLLGELNAAYLYAQLENSKKILDRRMELWNRYKEGLEDLIKLDKIEIQKIPAYCEHNAHMFYVKFKNGIINDRFIEYMKNENILCVKHYYPLHQSPAGKKMGVFSGVDKYTTKESEKLCRLPLFYEMSIREVDFIVDKIKKFIKSNL